MIIFKRKNILTLAFLFLGLICCSFNTSAISHEAMGEMDISYNVEQHGEYTWIIFGPISRWLQKNHQESAGAMGGSCLTRMVTDVCKKTQANAIKFDNIDYVYNKSSETLTVTGYEGSIYATAQTCVIEGLNFTNVDQIRVVRGEINRATSSQMSATQQAEYQRGDRSARIERDKIMETAKKKNPAPKLSVVKPLKRVVFIGNVLIIGENFCNTRAGMGGPNVLSHGQVGHLPIEYVDMSQSRINLICGGAFFECTELANVIPPQNSSFPIISAEAFEGSPAAKFLSISSEGYRDPKKPFSGSAINLGCQCTIM